VEDLLDRIVEDAAWCRGLEAVWERDCLLQPSDGEDPKCQGRMLVESALDFQDVLKEREQIGRNDERQWRTSLYVVCESGSFSLELNYLVWNT